MLEQHLLLKVAELKKKGEEGLAPQHEDRGFKKKAKRNVPGGTFLLQD